MVIGALTLDVSSRLALHLSWLLPSSSSETVPSFQVLWPTVNYDICVVVVVALPEPRCMPGASQIELLVFRILQLDFCFTHVEDRLKEKSTC